MAGRLVDRRRRLNLARLSALVATLDAPGLEPLTLADVLRMEAEKPLRGRADELQADGLFGGGQKQRELF